MIAVDTNILIAAHRKEHPRHDEALARLLHLAGGPALWALPVFCVAEFLRVVTHPKVFTPPTDLDTATAFIDRLIRSPHLRLLLPTDRFWSRLSAAVRDAEARGNLVFDAQIAAVCEEHGVQDLLTGDRDFSRFQRLRVEFL